MKRVFTLGLTATMLVALTFTNCKDDDEEYEPMKAGVLNEKTGLRVSQCASPSGDVYKFFYTFSLNPSERYSLAAIPFSGS